MKIKKISIILFLLILTGCGKSEVLTCTNTENANGLALSEKVVITFNGKKASNLVMNVDFMATDDNNKKIWDDLIDFYTKKFPTSNENGIVVKDKNDKDNYKYTINMVIDLNKVSEESMTKYDLDDLLNDNDTIDDIKLEAEQSGFTCSVVTKSN
jgi:hypothetical protein